MKKIISHIAVVVFTILVAVQAYAVMDVLKSATVAVEELVQLSQRGKRVTTLQDRLRLEGALNPQSLDRTTIATKYSDEVVDFSFAFAKADEFVRFSVGSLNRKDSLVIRVGKRAATQDGVVKPPVLQDLVGRLRLVADPAYRSGGHSDQMARLSELLQEAIDARQFDEFHMVRLAPDSPNTIEQARSYVEVVVELPMSRVQVSDFTIIFKRLDRVVGQSRADAIRTLILGI